MKNKDKEKHENYKYHLSHSSVENENAINFTSTLFGDKKFENREAGVTNSPGSVD